MANFFGIQSRSVWHAINRRQWSNGVIFPFHSFFNRQNVYFAICMFEMCIESASCHFRVEMAPARAFLSFDCRNSLSYRVAADQDGRRIVDVKWFEFTGLCVLFSFVRILCDRECFILSIDRHKGKMAQLTSIKMSKFDNQPWGFRLQGGIDFASPLTVQKVSQTNR